MAFENKFTKPQPIDYTNSGKTNLLSNKGIPLLEKHYNHYFNSKHTIRKSDFTNPNKREAMDLEHAIDVELQTIYDNTIYIQEKIRSHDKLKYGDFTIGLYKKFNNYPINSPDNLGEFFHLHCQYYVVGYLNKDNTDFLKLYILNTPRLINYLQRYHLDIIENAYININSNTISNTVETHLRRQFSKPYSWESEDEVYDYLITAKNTKCNANYSTTLFACGIEWENLKKEGVIEYEYSGSKV